MKKQSKVQTRGICPDDLKVKHRGIFLPLNLLLMYCFLHEEQTEGGVHNFFATFKRESAPDKNILPPYTPKN